MQIVNTPTLLETLREVLGTLVVFLQNTLVVVIVVAVGVAAGLLVRLCATFILRSVGLDRLSYRSGLSLLLEKGNVRKRPSEIIGAVLLWVVVFASVLGGLEAVGVPAFDRFGTAFAGYLPHLIVAVFVFVAGYFLMILLSRTVLIAAVNARLGFARWLSTGVQVLIMGFTLAVVAEELGIAGHMIEVAFSIVLGGLVFAAGLALGLAGKDIVKGWLEKQSTDGAQEGKKDGFSHL
ncbi:MAG: hypothetical protein V2A71_06495 [Candidatus Eisenbacteria bacterium]